MGRRGDHTMVILRSGSLVVLVALLPSVATAQAIGVVEVPPEISSPDQERLTGKRNGLRGRIDALNESIDAFTTRCASVDQSNSALMRECTATQSTLGARQDKLVDEVALFRIELIDVTRRQLAGCEADVAAAQKIIDEARRNLTRYMGSETASDMEAWAKLPDAARGEARTAALNAVMSLTLDRLSGQAAARKMTAPEITQVQNVVSRHGPLLDRVRAGMSRELTTVVSYESMLKAIGDLRTGLDVAENAITDKSDQEKALTATGQLLGIFVQNPTAKMVLMDLGIWTPILYTGFTAYFAETRVQQLEALTELDLKAVNSLSSLTVRQVARRAESSRRCERLLAVASAFAIG